VEVDGRKRPTQTQASQRGATAVEYAILASLVAAIVVVTVTTLGGQTTDLFQSLVWP
jgi:pilus assembly protein Flp/PilA